MRTSTWPNAVDVVTVKAIVAQGAGHDGWVPDQQMLEPLLRVGDDHISRTDPVPLSILPDVVLDPLLLVSTTLSNGVEVVQRHPVRSEPRARVAQTTAYLDMFAERYHLPSLGPGAEEPRLE